MTYSYKYSTRHWSYWLAAILSNLIGWPVVIMFGIGGYTEGFEGGILFAFSIGVVFIVCGAFFIYRIKNETMYEGMVSAERIICKKNDEITYEVSRGDVDHIAMSLVDFDSIYIYLKNNKRHEVGIYFCMDSKNFMQALEKNGYTVKV